MKKMKLAIIESPFAPNPLHSVETHVAYAKQLCRFALAMGYAPYASHLFYTQEGLLDDTNPDERALGIEAGLAWGKQADLTIVGCDFMFSSGMLEGVRRAHEEERPVYFVTKCPKCGAATSQGCDHPDCFHGFVQISGCDHPDCLHEGSLD